MAKKPTAQQKKQYLTSTQTAIEEKTKAQNNPGKPFMVTSAGVLPEELWQKYQKTTNKEQE